MKHLLGVKRRIEALPLAAYCIVAGIIALVGSTALISAAFYAARAFGVDPSIDIPDSFPTVMDGFGAIIFAPVVETFVLAGCLKILSGLGRTGSCVASAIIWGILHGLFAPVRFFGTVWSFFIFGFGYLLWRERSFKHAYAAAAVPHVIVNSVVIGLLASGA